MAGADDAYSAAGYPRVQVGPRVLELTAWKSTGGSETTSYDAAKIKPLSSRVIKGRASAS